MKRRPVTIVIEPSQGRGQEALMAVINQLIDEATQQIHAGTQTNTGKPEKAS